MKRQEKEEKRERNKEMRIELINAMLCLYDLTNTELTDIWENYYNLDISKQTSKILENCPRIKQVHEFCLQKLEQKIKQAESKEIEALKKKKKSAENIKKKNAC